MRMRKVFVVLMCVGVMGSVAWGQAEPTEEGAAAKKITKAEAEAWGEEFTEMTRDGIGFVADGMINKPAFKRRVFEGLEVLPEGREFVENLQYRFWFGVQSAGVQEGEYFRVLRVREVDGQWHVLCRHVSGDGELGYHDFVIARDSAGDIRAVDYMGNCSEFHSATIRMSMTIVLARQGYLDVEKLDEKTRLMFENWDAFVKMMELNGSGRVAEAYSAFAALPEGVRHSEMAMPVAIDIAENLESDDAKALVKRYIELNQNDLDPVLEYGSYYLDLEMYDLYFKSIDRLDRHLGGDGYLDLLRGDGYAVQEKYEQAAACYRRAGGVVPELGEAYWGLLRVGLDTTNHVMVAEALTLLKQKAGIAFEDVRHVPALEAFVASEAGKEWIAEHQAEGE